MAKNVSDFVQSCIDDYKHFVDIDSFSSFDVKPKEMTLEKSLKQGFDALAAFYDIPIALPLQTACVMLLCMRSTTQN